MHPSRPSFSTTAWLFPFAFAAHNLEEAYALPEWSLHAGAFHPPVQAHEFDFAIIVLTALGFLLTGLGMRRGGRWFMMLCVLWVAMLLNVLFPHLLATLVLRRYAPGVITALALNLPVTLYLLRRALREQRVLWSELVKACAWGLPAFLALLPALFWVGRSLPTAAHLRSKVGETQKSYLGMTAGLDAIQSSHPAGYSISSLPICSSVYLVFRVSPLHR